MPLSPVLPPAPLSPAADTAPSLGAVLLLAAHPATGRLLGNLVAGWGWVPLGPAATVAAALALLAGGTVPVACAVLDDGGMEGGPEPVAWALTRAGVPYVWLTGRAGRARQGGRVLLKPLNPDRLRAELAALLASRAARRLPAQPVCVPACPWRPASGRYPNGDVPPPGPWHHSLRASELR